MTDPITVTGSPSFYKARLSTTRKGRRKAAVEAALELIHADLSSVPSHNNVDAHMLKLGAYADAIEAALGDFAEDAGFSQGRTAM